MDELTIEKIKEMRAAITPAPWVYMGNHEVFGGEIRSCGASEDDPTAFSHVADTPPLDDRPADFEFIAAAPDIVDFLLAEIERIREIGFDMIDESESLKKHVADLNHDLAATIQHCDQAHVSVTD